jgi:hypothetical protein
MKVTIITLRAYDFCESVCGISLRAHRCYAGFFMLKFKHEYNIIYCKFELGC